MNTKLTPHPQADILRAIADGVPVQFQRKGNLLWEDLAPNFFFLGRWEDTNWRIKPKPKVKVWRWMFVSNDGTGTVRVTRDHYTEERVVVACKGCMVLNQIESTMKEIEE